MEKYHSQPQRLKIQKIRTADGLRARNTAYQACKACHDRKKRCVTTTTRVQCTYCFRQGQRCIPRTRPVRSVQKCKAETSRDQSAQQLRYKFDSPLPPGIDHEAPVPRWSAVYSLFSEIMRLIPPEAPQAANERKRVSAKDEQDPSWNKHRQADYRSHSRSRDAQKQSACQMSINGPDWNHLLTPNTCADDHQVLSLAPEGVDKSSFLAELDSLLRF